MKIRLLLLSLMSILLLLCVPLIGCDSGESLATEEIADIIEAVGTNTSDVDTITFDMDMSADINVSASGQSFTVNIGGEGEGSIDNVNEELYVPLTANITGKNVPFAGDIDESMSLDIYIVDGWLYMNTDGEWTKTELPQTILAEQDPNMLIGQLTGLLALVDVEDKGSEDINGVDCYKFHVSPDLGQLAGYAIDQIPQSEIGDNELDIIKSVKDIMSSFDVDCTFWISKDDNLLMKVDLDLSGDISSQDIPELANMGLGNLDIDIDVTGHIEFDYNQPVSIDLPSEALNAYYQGTYE